MPLSDDNLTRMERLLAQVDFSQGGTAAIRRDGFLWTRTTARKAWHPVLRIRGGPSQVRAATAWLKDALQTRTAAP